jgi:hypothetical protein
LITPEERTARILAELDAVGDPDLIRDLGTPQGLAADWLINEDPRLVCPGDEKLVQRWAVAVMYFSTDGGDWFQCSADGTDPCGDVEPFVGKRRFLSPFSECQWAGITCDVDGCVTEVEFEENNLVGTIPTEMGLLTDLAVWGMERGGLSSTIPTQIGALSNLVFLDFDFNLLTGSLPTELYLLTNLTQIDLNNNQLTGNVNQMGVFLDLEFLQLHSTCCRNHGIDSMPASYMIPCPQVTSPLSHRPLSLRTPLFSMEPSNTSYIYAGNLFTGTLPDGLGGLALMTTFTLHETDFVGAMPDSVCALRTTNGGLLSSLIADCDSPPGGGPPQIECDCCSDCRGDP